MSSASIITDKTISRMAEIEKELKPSAKEIKAGKIDTGYIG